jgi:[acyl-carrier-protein] S-malonyltransferase
MGMVYVFPGQGSQHLGMAVGVLRREIDSRQIYDLASEIAGIDVLDLCTDGDPSILARTDYCQISVAATSLAWLQLLQREGFQAEAVAGHSLGEYCAACAAGCFGVEDALRLIWARGRAMLDCSRTTPGFMFAVVGMKIEDVQDLVNEIADRHFIHLANHNSLTQTVVAGEKSGLEALEKAASQRGARVIRLRVTGPFHTPAFAGARDVVEEHLARIDIQDPSIILLSGYTGTVVRDATSVAHSLAAGITSPVLWFDLQRELVKRGADPQVEVGPGNVLCSMARRDYPDLHTCHAADLVEEAAGRSSCSNG